MIVTQKCLLIVWSSLVRRKSGRESAQNFSTTPERTAPEESTAHVRDGLLSDRVSGL